VQQPPVSAPRSLPLLGATIQWPTSRLSLVLPFTLNHQGPTTTAAMAVRGPNFREVGTSVAAARNIHLWLHMEPCNVRCNSGVSGCSSLQSATTGVANRHLTLPTPTPPTSYTAIECAPAITHSTNRSGHPQQALILTLSIVCPVLKRQHM
jgi:hypothetical protein